MQALTVKQPWAQQIASGAKRLEMRTRRLMRVGERYVICSGAPNAVTLVEVECTEVFPIRAFNYRWAHRLKIIRKLQPRKVRGQQGLWELRRSRHSRDAGYID